VSEVIVTGEPVGFPPQLGELAGEVREPLRHDVDDIAFALDLGKRCPDPTFR